MHIYFKENNFEFLLFVIRKEEIGDLVMKMLTAGSENDDEEERNSKQTQKNGHTDATNKLIQEHNKTKGKKNVPNKKSDNSGSEQDCKEESADEEQDYEEESADEDLKDEEVCIKCVSIHVCIDRRKGNGLLFSYYYN